MHKAGRYTAAVLLVLVGGSVIFDKVTGSHLTSELVGWWPVLFIMLGLEYIGFNMKYGHTDRQLKLDLKGVIFALLISAIVIVSTQTTDFAKKFGSLDGISMGDIVQFFGEGRKFDEGVTSIPLPSSVENVKLTGRNGTMVLKSGNVNNIEIAVTVHVQMKDEKEAAQIADASKLEYSVTGDTLDIQALGKEYIGSIFGRSYPRMDIIVTMPAQQKVNYELHATNGKIQAAQLPVKQRFSAQTSNGAIEIADLDGELRLGTTNGLINSSKTSGTISLKTTNGRVELTDHRGDAVVGVSNGELKLAGIAGSVEARATNGAIKIDGKLQKVKVETSNGSIDVTSGAVEDDWDIKTNNGRIALKLPSHGDYRVDGNGRKNNIQSSLPLTIDNKTIRGTVGSGQHLIKVESNGSISIQPSN
ncbi:DUF4097 family beta strand repeat-containing protein [Paenibacillus cremeus]|nr:DUF4097 family beta strand repeat-containing protein [Paenibacillus cremeus]